MPTTDKHAIGKNEFEIEIWSPEGVIKVRPYDWYAVTNQAIRVHSDWDPITSDDSREFTLPMDTRMRNMLEKPVMA